MKFSVVFSLESDGVHASHVILLVFNYFGSDGRSHDDHFPPYCTDPMEGSIMVEDAFEIIPFPNAVSRSIWKLCFM